MDRRFDDLFESVARIEGSRARQEPGQVATDEIGRMKNEWDEAEQYEDNDRFEEMDKEEDEENNKKKEKDKTIKKKKEAKGKKENTKIKSEKPKKAVKAKKTTEKKRREEENDSAEIQKTPKLAKNKLKKYWEANYPKKNSNSRATLVFEVLTTIDGLGKTNTHTINELIRVEKDEDLKNIETYDFIKRASKNMQFGEKNRIIRDLVKTMKTDEISEIYKEIMYNNIKVGSIDKITSKLERAKNTVLANSGDMQQTYYANQIHLRSRKKVKDIIASTDRYTKEVESIKREETIKQYQREIIQEQDDEENKKEGETQENGYKNETRNNVQSKETEVNKDKGNGFTKENEDMDDKIETEMKEIHGEGTKEGKGIGIKDMTLKELIEKRKKFFDDNEGVAGTPGYGGQHKRNEDVLEIIGIEEKIMKLTKIEEEKGDKNSNDDKEDEKGNKEEKNDEGVSNQNGHNKGKSNDKGDATKSSGEKRLRETEDEEETNTRKKQTNNTNGGDKNNEGKTKINKLSRSLKRKEKDKKKNVKKDNEEQTDNSNGNEELVGTEIMEYTQMDQDLDLYNSDKEEKEERPKEKEYNQSEVDELLTREDDEINLSIEYCESEADSVCLIEEIKRDTVYKPGNMAKDTDGREKKIHGATWRGDLYWASLGEMEVYSKEIMEKKKYAIRGSDATREEYVVKTKIVKGEKKIVYGRMKCCFNYTDK